MLCYISKQCENPDCGSFSYICVTKDSWVMAVERRCDDTYFPNHFSNLYAITTNVSINARPLAEIFSSTYVWESAARDGHLIDGPKTSSRLRGVVGCRWHQTGHVGREAYVQQWTATGWYDDDDENDICTMRDYHSTRPTIPFFWENHHIILNRVEQNSVILLLTEKPFSSFSSPLLGMRYLVWTVSAALADLKAQLDSHVF